MRIGQWFLIVLGLAVVGAGCGGNDGSSDDAAPAAPNAPATTEEQVTTTRFVDSSGFAEEVLPIIEFTCARCHTGGGPGTPHLRLETVADAIENSDLIVEAVGLGAMPPWPSSNLSVAFKNDWSLTATERDALIAWARRPLTDLDPTTPITSTAGIKTLSDVDYEIAPLGGYDGEQDQPDEYRCLIYDLPFDETTWIKGYEFVPDQTEVVHHAIGYKLGGEQRAAADVLAANDPENGGWTCFGGTGLPDQRVLGWVPGLGPREYPEGSGLRLRADDFIVIQVHYHYEVEAPVDFSSLRLDVAGTEELPLDSVESVRFFAPAEIPCASWEEGPLCERSAALAAAEAKYGEAGTQANLINSICEASPEDFAHMTDGVASASCDLPVREGGQIVSVLGHEHEIGASFRMTLNPGSPDELILLDIPDWDFQWQLAYEPVDEIFVKPADIIRIECSWDRSLRDDDLEPAYVLWADGTHDEMCFATVGVREVVR